MKLWAWFCRLGTALENKPVPFLPAKRQPIAVQPTPSGVDIVCTRLCGQSGCRCGSTIRGLHCIWSHYRIQ